MIYAQKLCLIKFPVFEKMTRIFLICEIVLHLRCYGWLKEREEAA